MPYITGYNNPLYNPTNQGFFFIAHLSSISSNHCLAQTPEKTKVQHWVQHQQWMLQVLLPCPYKVSPQTSYEGVDDDHGGNVDDDDDGDHGDIYNDVDHGNGPFAIIYKRFQSSGVC